MRGVAGPWFAVLAVTSTLCAPMRHAQDADVLIIPGDVPDAPARTDRLAQIPQSGRDADEVWVQDVSLDGTRVSLWQMFSPSEEPGDVLRDHLRRLWVCEVKGNRLHRVLTTSECVQGGWFSADGESMLLHDRVLAWWHGAVLWGKRPLLVTEGAETIQTAVVSPDRQRVALLVWLDAHADGRLSVRVCDDGGNREVARWKGFTDYPHHEPGWAPNGDLIGIGDGASASAWTWIVDPTTGRKWQVDLPLFTYHIAWRPSGREIVFPSGDSRELRARPVDSQDAEPTVLVRLEGRNGLRAHIDEIRASPSAEVLAIRVSYIAKGGSRAFEELWCLSHDGKGRQLVARGSTLRLGAFAPNAQRLYFAVGNALHVAEVADELR